MGLFVTPRFVPPRNTADRTFDSVTTGFKKHLSAADIAALKATIESNYVGVAFNYTGVEFDYEVVLEGPGAQYQKAMNELFPKGRNDIIIQPFETLP